jgi:adenylosuccinate lyase
MKTEFGEVEEPVPPGTVGSSTMPQKRNPKLCQDIIAAAAEVRASVPLVLEAMQTEHEADRTTSLIMEAAEARASIALGDALSRLVEVSRGLRLDPERMRRNSISAAGSLWPKPSCSISAPKSAASTPTTSSATPPSQPLSKAGPSPSCWRPTRA